MVCGSRSIKVRLGGEARRPSRAVCVDHPEKAVEPHAALAAQRGTETPHLTAPTSIPAQSKRASFPETVNYKLQTENIRAP